MACGTYDRHDHDVAISTGTWQPFHDCEAVLKLPATPLNTWYHLAGVVEGKKSSLYVHDLQGKLITQRENWTGRLPGR